jgi:hypothetical protein
MAETTTEEVYYIDLAVENNDTTEPDDLFGKAKKI